MATKLAEEEYPYRRVTKIIESADSGFSKGDLLFEELSVPLLALYVERIKTSKSETANV